MACPRRGRRRPAGGVGGTRPVRRDTGPDPKFGSRSLQKFINRVMMAGKKSLAERIVYGALDSIEKTARRSPIDVFDLAMRNATPVIASSPIPFAPIGLTTLSGSSTKKQSIAGISGFTGTR